jgi:hypothetical protein
MAPFGAEALSVKNTFLTINDDEMRGIERVPPRRCSSVPASARVGERCVAAEEPVPASRGAPKGPRGKELAASPVSEASTDISDVDTPSTDAAMSVPLSGSRTTLNSNATVWLPGMASKSQQVTTVLVPVPVQGTGGDGAEGSDPNFFSYSCSPCSVLNSQAKAWTPASGKVPAPVPVPANGLSPWTMPSQQTWSEMEVQRAFGKIVSSLKAALASHAKVDVTVGSQSWCVYINPPPEASWQFTNNALKSAKDTLLHATSQSKLVHVMGYEKNPFTNFHNGFECTLIANLNSNCACWDLISKGYCHRGGSCRWDHAAFQSKVCVMINEATW